MKQIKLKKLEESFEEGIISREEYEKKKKEIGEMPEKKTQTAKEEPKEAKFRSDRIMIIGAVLLILLFAAVFGVRYFTQEQPQTIDDLHQLNFKGKLKPDQGYLYKDVYSFVKFDDLWYMQLASPKKTRLYNVQFRYGPKEVEDIKISGLEEQYLNGAPSSRFYIKIEDGCLGNCSFCRRCRHRLCGRVCQKSERPSRQTNPSSESSLRSEAEELPSGARL